MAHNYVMIVALITFICFSLSFGDDAMLPTSHNYLIASPNCNERCGDVNIPFPFGMTADCALHNQFLVTCNYSFHPPQPFLGNRRIEITSISLSGQLKVLQFISRDCYRAGISTDNNQPFIVLPSLLTVNNPANSFIAVGCDTYAIVRGYYTKFGTKIEYLPYITGCMSMCNSIDDVVHDTCSGVGCCKTSIPKGAWNVTITLSSYYNYNDTDIKNDLSCSYAFVVDQANFSFSKTYLSSLQKAEKLPLVLDWAIGEETCEIAKINSTTYGCKSKNSDCQDNSNGYPFSCMQGYDGNPYLKDGCQGISGDGYTECNHDNHQRKIQNIYLVIGTFLNFFGILKARGVTIGVALMVFIIFGWSYTAFQRRKMLMMKKKFFQENGGLVLLQRLKVGEEGSSNTNIVNIFTAEELQRATNDFDKDRVVGQGGYGTVYKGYLKDNCITEVPLLVYEFISNGTLSEHLHDKLKASTLYLDIRLKIAAETAGLLSYLHSAAYPPIIHSDIKSVNILLDKNFTAKVSDFGASRLLSTLVQGTLGYLDPEYLQTNQLTEKSDVYSFGVVLVELLTGRKALCFQRPEERSLAQYFISSVEKGDDRPTMKEVAAELEAGSKLKHSWAQTDQQSEEIESLLPGFGYEYNEHSIQADSITSHVTIPFPGGR
ncbi:hypothetical protein H5410_045322 [Solanum commersonii]|uniref:Protein kinase domain-containing protein n=1 Tax=Solanum commersonii TaxID=4109 RepID=A0A9J5XDC5_SOLCO|nr:hypothetical protein H5410_045322 [Solanum commersonii]